MGVVIKLAFNIRVGVPLVLKRGGGRQRGIDKAYKASTAWGLRSRRLNHQQPNLCGPNPKL
jgi:hypothetical protein